MAIEKMEKYGQIGRYRRRENRGKGSRETVAYKPDVKRLGYFENGYILRSGVGVLFL